MDWDKVKIFHAVASAGSFTSAAKLLNMSQSALSRQIKSLEASLNASLFTRHARGLVLTHEGERLFATASEMAARMDATQRELMETRSKPFGPLRVTTTRTFGSMWLAPRVKEFCEAYPDIELRMHLSDEYVDLATGEAEMAIRFGAPQQADLIQRHLIDMRHFIYAAPKYLSEHGTPEEASDLDSHALIGYGPETEISIKNINWILSAGSTGYARKAILEVNSLVGVLRAVRSGLGIAALPSYLASSAPGLVRILADVEAPMFQAYLTYPSELKGSKRISVFRDFLLKIIDESREEL